ncbi:hypothetical protein B484DRAFT_411982, partial [Ochromonadaceae sp. CCMP2298]
MEHFFSIDSTMVYWNFYLDYGPLNMTADEAWNLFKTLKFPFWHDATPTVCTYNLTVLGTLRGLAKAREHRYFDWERFNIEEYEYYEQ